MVFACTGSTFTDMSLDYSTAGQLIGTITASSAWDEDTKGTFHLNLAGKTSDDTFTLCDTLTSNSVACGSAGAVEVDLSGIAASHLGQNFTSLALTTLITTAYIDFSAKPDGSTTEQCTQNIFTSGYNSTNIGSNSSQLDTATNRSQINSGLLYVGIALAVVVAGVGLAAYAMKRAKISIGPIIQVKRMSSRSRSNRSHRSRSHSKPKNDAEEKVVDDGAVRV
eukprot:scaffold855_cov140-Skeletonema_menzelii.AAC.14